MCADKKFFKKTGEINVVLCMLEVGGRQCVHEDGWEHQALGSRNVMQKDIKDIRYETPAVLHPSPHLPL